jgi:hypothetical protein
MVNMKPSRQSTRILPLLIAAVALAFGCDSPKDAGKKKSSTKENESHAEQAPRKGKLFADEGDRHHAELLIDKAGKKATVYLLDHKVKEPVCIGEKSISLNMAEKPPVQIELKADAQTSDPAGTASRFSGAHDLFGSDLDLDKVEIEVKINGKSLVFKLDKD